MATILMEDIRYLLFRRVARPDRDLDAFWQGVTGGLEDGETPRDAALRELYEETGIVQSDVQPIGYAYSFPMRDKWRQLYPPGTQEIVEHVFVTVLEEHLEPALSNEHDQWGWYRFDEATRLLSYRESKEGLERCHIHLLNII